MPTPRPGFVNVVHGETGDVAEVHETSAYVWFDRGWHVVNDDGEAVPDEDFPAPVAPPIEVTHPTADEFDEIAQLPAGETPGAAPDPTPAIEGES